MKRFFGAILALLILSLFCIPVSAATCESHITDGMPFGVEGYFEAVDNDTHNVCYTCDICYEKIVVSTEAHDVSDVDNKCAYCGFKVHSHTFKIECEAVDEDKHIERSTCPCGYVTEEEKAHEFFTFTNDLVCMRCGLQVHDVAVDGSTPSVDTDEEQTPTDEEFEGDSFIISQFFEEKILPLLISAGSALVMLVGSLIPYIKKSGKLKRLQGIYTATKAENAKYAELLATVDFDKFKDAIETVLTDDLKKKIAELGNYDGRFENMEAKLEILLAQLQAMRDGAMNAWAQSPAAVAALSVSPTETAVRKLAQQNAAFEKYIKAQKGEEADAIISELKGEVNNDEQGNVPAV